MLDAEERKHHETIMNWLSESNYPTQQYDIISRKEKGTGKWFLDSQEFKGWVQGPDKVQGSDKTLFCPGIPGAGKTMIAAIAIEYLQQKVQQDDIGLAYLFCNYKSQAVQTTSSLLAALLKQLVQNRPDLSNEIQSMYKSHSTKGTKPSVDDILGLLKSICSKYPAVFIIVDALDEISDRGIAKNLVDKIYELQAGKDVQLLCTSRHLPDLTQKFGSSLMLEVKAEEEDVRQYISGQISHLPNCIQRDDELKLIVQSKIAEAVGGM
jgi:hypothetical protein